MLRNDEVVTNENKFHERDAGFPVMGEMRLMQNEAKLWGESLL
jgi:hypothetical protein